MTTRAQFEKLALAHAGTTAVPHVDRMAFRTSRKIFATLTADGKEANVLLELDAQAELSDAHPGAIFPVPGGWGRMGYTTLVLPKLGVTLVKKILADAHALALPPPRKTKRKR